MKFVNYYITFCLSAIMFVFLVINNVVAAGITLIVSKKERADKEIVIYKGSFESIYQTIDKSREYDSTLKKVIIIDDGKYFLNKPLVLDRRDNGLLITSREGATPILYGGRLLTNWHKEGKQFWAMDLPEVRYNAWDFRMLLVNGRMCARSRLPKEGFFQNLNIWDVVWMNTSKGGWQRKPTYNDLTKMIYDRKDIGPWVDVRNAELTIYHKWDESVVGLDSIDEKSATFTLHSRTGHPPGAFGVHNYVVWNVLEGMTEPGQWYLDRTQGKVVYWPLDGEDMNHAEAIAPTVESIIRIEGTKEKPVHGIIINGLTLSVTNTPLKAGGFGAGSFDGALSVKYTDSCKISDLTITSVAGQGIKEFGSRGLLIERCKIYNIGACGIIFNEGNKIVSNNLIHHIGIMYPSAIALWGSGNQEFGSQIIHNEIHDSPYTAIACEGNNHRIESNLIYAVMQVLQDGGGIYVTSCKNIVLRGNFVRDILSSNSSIAAGFYLDELSENCLVEGNLTINVPLPTMSNRAKNNIIHNNVFLNKDTIAIKFSASSDYLFEKNVICAVGGIRIQGVETGDDVINNIFFTKGGSVDGAIGKNLFNNPQINNDGLGRVTFANNSFIKMLGIKAIDVSAAGVQKVKK